MKRIGYIVFGIAVICGAIVFIGTRPGKPPASSVTPTTDISEPGVQKPPLAASPNGRLKAGVRERQRLPAANKSKTTASSEIANQSDPLSTAMETLLSPHSTHEQKQAAWKLFADTNTLDQAITEFERLTKSEPGLAEPHAVLGVAYLHKCGMIQDVREQGILAMKADKSFDTALEIDSSNWDARYTKAFALSKWPEQMNKGPEVIELFTTLIEQQEKQRPQPNFAMSYVKLGEQYEKAGNSGEARQIFERGARLFPEHQELQAKLQKQ